MSRLQTRNLGKFWPTVRAMNWEKAQHLYQEDQAKTMGSDFKGITATHKELREGGYFYTAKLIVLRNLYLQNKNPHSQEEPTSVSTKIHSSILKSVQQNKKKRRKKKMPKPGMTGLCLKKDARTKLRIPIPHK